MRTLILPLALALLISPACGGGSGTTDDTTASSSSTATSTATDTPTGAAFCGDGAHDEGEDCDGDDLADKTCATLDAMWSGGTLACSADCKFVTSACESDPGAPQVALNEVTSKGASDGPFADKGDAIELTNVGAETIDLTGWKLSDDPAFPIDKTYVFPPGSTLAPGAYFVLLTLDAGTGEGDFPFGISTSKEETLTLADASSVTIDQLIVQGADATVSYCRLPDGTGEWQLCDLTLGTANVAASATCGDGVLGGTEPCDGDELGGQTCEALGFPGGALACTAACVLDTSKCESASEVALNELESTDDQIELHNAGAADVDISGWILTDDVVDANYDPAADDEKLVFAAGTSIAAGEFLVVPAGDLPGQHPFGLSGSGDAVTLLDADLGLVSQVAYASGQAAQSYCRIPDGPGGAWVANCQPTFGAANKGP